MSEVSTCRRTATVTLVLASIAAVIVGAQSTGANPASTASSDQIVADVRALRADLQRTSAASLQAQILIGRLQVEEQRLNALSSQLSEVRRGLLAQKAATPKLSEAVKSTEHLIAIGNRNLEATTLVDARAALALIQEEEQRLVTEEASLITQLNVERQRWIEFNTRLDELERGIPKPSRNP
jgi:hypothetical protein